MKVRKAEKNSRHAAAGLVENPDISQRSRKLSDKRPPLVIASLRDRAPDDNAKESCAQGLRLDVATMCRPNRRYGRRSQHGASAQADGDNISVDSWPAMNKRVAPPVSRSPRRVDK